MPVCQTFVNTMGLAVRLDSPIKNIADLVAAAKQKPGALNYGHPGVLTIPHLAMEEFPQTAPIEIKDIPFRGGPQTLTELIGGRIDVVSIVMGTEVGQNIRVIGVFGEKRLATFRMCRPSRSKASTSARRASADCWRRPQRRRRLWPSFRPPAPKRPRTMRTDDRRSAPGSPTTTIADAAAFPQRLARDIEARRAC